MSGKGSTGEASEAGGFPVTRWTRVLAAKGDSTEAKGALSDLCAAYYAPVRSFIEHTVRDVDAATVEDLAQEFFAQLLGRSGIAGVKRGRGKFRSYLLGAVKHFLASWRERESAEKRGGGKEILSLDAAGDTATRLRPSGYGAASGEIADERAEVSDAYFDRQWALTVLERALGEVSEEYGKVGKGETFGVLKAWLTGNEAGMSQADAAAKLGMSEGAVKVAVHRLRKRFREVLRRELAETVERDEDVAAELRYLAEALGTRDGS